MTQSSEYDEFVVETEVDLKIGVFKQKLRMRVRDPELAKRITMLFGVSYIVLIAVAAYLISWVVINWATGGVGGLIGLPVLGAAALPLGAAGPYIASLILSVSKTSDKAGILEKAQDGAEVIKKLRKEYKIVESGDSWLVLERKSS